VDAATKAGGSSLVKAGVCLIQKQQRRLNKKNAG
jgi:hypothetical protein